MSLAQLKFPIIPSGGQVFVKSLLQPSVKARLVWVCFSYHFYNILWLIWEHWGMPITLGTVSLPNSTLEAPLWVAAQDWDKVPAIMAVYCQGKSLEIAELPSLKRRPCLNHHLLPLPFEFNSWPQQPHHIQILDIPHRGGMSPAVQPLLFCRALILTIAQLKNKSRHKRARWKQTGLAAVRMWRVDV